MNDVNTIENGAIHCSRSKECTELLMREGVDVNLKDNCGMTPLHYAVHHKSIGCIMSLILAGADVNVKEHHGLTPLHSAILNYRSTDSAVCGSEGCVKLLLEAGADVNIFSCSDTALHYTAMQGLVSCFDLLLRAGADVNALNTKDKSSLMFAADNNTLDSVRLLLQAGAEVRITDAVGFSALQCSLIAHLGGGKSEAVPEMVRLLLAAGEKKKGISERSLHMLIGHVPMDDNPTEPNIKQLSAMSCQYLCEDDPTTCLKDICRQAIREHLLQMSRVNLFVRVPHLGLPSLLAEFLLYDLSVEL